MPAHENEIQLAIIEAVKYFFSSSTFGFNIPSHRIEVVAPSAGGQAKSVEDFGRKPYDVAFYATDTVVLFFEVKERDKAGNIKEFKPAQCQMLTKLASNGVDVRYAYNGWDFAWGKGLTPSEVLKQAHVREAIDMCSPVLINPVAPAIILQAYLESATSSGARTLVDILQTDVRQLDNFNSMPLMILANLNPNDARVLIDRAPSGALKMMKSLFKLPAQDRSAKLLEFASNANRQAMLPVAKSIFDLKDNWMSSLNKMRP